MFKENQYGQYLKDVLDRKYVNVLYGKEKNMEQPLVSIIIPVYRVEKYLRRCLDSVKNQTYKNIEVILVDDGSPDNCPKICDEYAATDNRFHVIHKKNGGVSSARNAGIDYCIESKLCDHYITFVDADDWLPLSSLNCLYNRAKETNADLVCGCFSRVLISGAKQSHFEDIAFSTEDKTELSKNIPSTFASWAKLYKADIIRKQDIKFPLDVTINEDTFFVYTYIQYCKSIAFTSENTYYYNHLNNSSFSREIHMGTNQYYAKALSLRLSFFDTKNFPVHEYSVILELFCVCLMVYTNKLPCAEATDKIRETYEIFHQFLELIDDDWLSSSDDRFSKQYKVCRRDLAEGKYDLVYQKLLASSKMSAKAALKKGLRKLLIPVEQFFVFRLNWFYK